VPFSSFSADLATGTPTFSWISPDDCNNGHSCEVSVSDAWLRDTVTLIKSSGAWKANGILIVTWDEDDGRGDNHVLTMVIAPGQKPFASNVPYNHYSLLATIEDLMGVSRLGEAAAAHAMQDLIGP
jgi:acid phosphatase